MSQSLKDFAKWSLNFQKEIDSIMQPEELKQRKEDEKEKYDHIYEPGFPRISAWVEVIGSKNIKPGEAVLMLTAKSEFVRYHIGTWRVGHGFEDMTGRRVFNVEYFARLQLGK